jgi:hypothetical protein
MATNPHYSTLSRNAALNGSLDLANGGFIDILDGAQPVNANTAITTQNVLASFALGNPAFAAASGGSKALNAVSSVAASRSGTAAWYRMYESDHTTAVEDGSAGVSATDLTIPSVTIVSGETVSVSSGTFTTAA